MTTPVRLQLSRRKGFNLQAVSKATNGLEAVLVSRPTAFGNPFGAHLTFPLMVQIAGHATYVSGRSFFAADLFRLWLDGKLVRNRVVDGLYERRQKLLAGLPLLRGKNLACWCKDSPGISCHADVLLELANR